MKYELFQIAGGLAGTDRTVREIARHVQADLQRPGIRLLATEILRHIPSKDQEAEARAIYDYVSRSIRYQKDPIGIETVQSPLVTLRLKAGDCDDHVALVAALALSVGIPARLRVVGYFKDEMVHIFPELNINNRWTVADTTEPGRGFGWRPPTFPVERLYNLNGEVDSMNLSQIPTGTPTRGQVKGSIYREVTKVLTSNWREGRINLADVRGYLRVIAEGNFPTREPLLVEPTETAIRDFIGRAQASGAISPKPRDHLSGMEGMDGFLSSVWGAVKKGVSAVGKTVGKVFGSSGTTSQAPSGSPQAPVFQVTPTVNIPEGVIRTQVSPAAASAFGEGLFGPYTMPILIGGGVLLVVLLMRK